MSNKEMMWWTKYRPQNLDELIAPEKTKNIIRAFGKNVPNLLFVGGAGTGKTTTAQIIVKDILDCDYLYINASDENGIDTIRNKVMGFAQTKSFDGELKVVILDEADFLSISAQAILRNTMESYADTTRFILTGNFKHKISSALQSRCQSVDIRPEWKDGFKRCVDILKKENITIQKDQAEPLKALIKGHFPDLRKCINEMQKYCKDGVLNIEIKTNTDELCEMLFQNIHNGCSCKTRKYLIENETLFDGDYESLLQDLLNYYYEADMDDTKKKQSILTIADHLYKMVHVTDREICGFACLLELENI